MYQGTTVPAGATRLYPWEDRDGEPVRPFLGTSGGAIETPDGRAIEVYVEGEQWMVGVVRTIVVNDVEVTPEQFRAFVAACGDVLEEVEGMSDAIDQGRHREC